MEVLDTVLLIDTATVNRPFQAGPASRSSSAVRDGTSNASTTTAAARWESVQQTLMSFLEQQRSQLQQPDDAVSRVAMAFSHNPQLTQPLAPLTDDVSQTLCAILLSLGASEMGIAESNNNNNKPSSSSSTESTVCRNVLEFLWEGLELLLPSSPDSDVVAGLKRGDDDDGEKQQPKQQTCRRGSRIILVTSSVDGMSVKGSQLHDLLVLIDQLREHGIRLDVLGLDFCSKSGCGIESPQEPPVSNDGAAATARESDTGNIDEDASAGDEKEGEDNDTAGDADDDDSQHEKHFQYSPVEMEKLLISVVQKTGGSVTPVSFCPANKSDGNNSSPNRSDSAKKRERSTNDNAATNNNDTATRSDKRACFSSSSSATKTPTVKQSPIKLLATAVDVQEHRQRHASCLDKLRHPCWTQCQTLRELIGVDHLGESSGREIEWIVVANYLIDFEFLLNEVPELISVPNATVFVHVSSQEISLGCSPGRIWKNATPNAVDIVLLNPQEVPKHKPNATSTFNPLRVQMRSGVHHSKIFLVGFGDGSLRVVIHTANLVYRDIHLKAQGAYVQEFPLKKTTTASRPCAFEQDLVSYFETYGYQKKRFPARTPGADSTQQLSLADCLAQYDFSSAQVVLLPSTPGYHKIDAAPPKLRGHLKLKHAIAAHCATNRSSSTTRRPAPIVCQYSSVGLMSRNKLEQLVSSMDVAVVQRPPNVRPGPKVPLTQQLRLVYPTVQEIRESVEGYNGGGSVPGRAKNVNHKELKPLYHKWTSSSRHNPLNKSRHVPHIKTFYQLCWDGSSGKNEAAASMEWFALTSHNLSMPAWGEVQNTKFGRQLVVQHWELGVFVTPSLLQCDRLVPYGQQQQQEQEEASAATKSNTTTIATVPLPYDFIPQPYSNQDEAWKVDQVYPVPDRFGNRCPV